MSPGEGVQGSKEFSVLSWPRASADFLLLTSTRLLAYQPDIFPTHRLLLLTHVIVAIDIFLYGNKHSSHEAGPGSADDS